MTTIGNRERIAWIFCFRKWKFQQINGVTLSQMWQSGHCHTMSEKKNDRWTKYLANYTNSYNSIIIVKTNETGVGVLPEIILRRLKSLRSPSTSPPPPWVAILYIYHRKEKSHTIRKLRLYKFIRPTYSHPLCGWWLIVSTKLYIWAISYCHFWDCISVFFVHLSTDSFIPVA